MQYNFYRRTKQALVTRQRQENKPKNTLAAPTRHRENLIRIPTIALEIAENEYASNPEADR